MKKVAVLLFLVASVYVSGVHSALGFSFDIPNLSASVSSSIGSGTSQLVSVQTATQVNVNVDRTGTMVVLQQMIGAVTNIFSTLLVKLKSVSISRSATNTQVIFQEITFLYGNASNALGNATAAANSITKMVKPTVLNGMIIAIGSLNFSMASMETVTTDLQTALTQASQASPPVTAATISSFITADLITRFSGSIATLVLSMNRMATAVQTAVSVRNTAISYQTTTNQTIKASVSDINSLLASVNSTIDSSTAAITQSGNSFVSIANSTFAPVTSQPFNWNNGNIANLTSFLANFTSVMQVNFTETLNVGNTYAKANISSVLMNETSILSQVVLDASANISDTGSMSTSMYADGCVATYNGMLSSSSMSLSRVTECVKLESGVLGVLDSFAQQAISKIKHDAIKTMNQLQMCTDKNGPCVAMLFASFANQNNRTTVAMSLAANYTSTSLIATADRITDCVGAVSAEIVSLAQSTQTNFNGCLINGS